MTLHCAVPAATRIPPAGGECSLVGGWGRRIRSPFSTAEMLSPGSRQGGEVTGEGFLGDRTRRTTAVGCSAPPSRTERILRCPTVPCGECLFLMLKRPALYCSNQRLTTHRLRDEDPVCFEMLTVAFCPCQPGLHLRQGLLFHIFPGKISWLTARALPCRCPSAQSMCRVLGRG